MVATVTKSDAVAVPDRDPGRYVALAWKLANGHARKYPRYDADELVGVAMEGIIKACRSNTYDPARWSFLAFAWWHGRSALSHYIREQDRRGFTGFGAEFYDRPADAGVTVGAIADGTPGRADDGPDPAEAADTAEAVGAALAAIPSRERSVLRSLICDGRPYDAVGRELGVGACRVGQLKRAGLRRLRDDFPELESLI